VSTKQEKVQKADLAIYGGPKVRSKPMPSRMAFGEESFRQAIDDLFDHYRARSADFGYQDTYEALYTDAFVRYLGAGGYADAVNTGTAALFVALAALQLPAGSHVIVSPITDPGTINAIILNQLVPVLADCSPNSYNVGAEQFAERISDKTRAAIIVHAAGRAAPIDSITEIARERGILILEDCSQAHGAKLNGRKVGSYGDIAAFSTMYRKAHATGSCGGVVFTTSEERYRLVRAYADRGKPFWEKDFNDKDPTGFLFPALNFNIDEISCAIGIKSLEKLDDTIRKRLSFIRALAAGISASSEVCSPSAITDDDSPFFYPVFVDSSKLTCSKEEFALAVRSEGIDLNPHYMYVVSEWPYVQPYLSDRFECRNASECRNNSFNILLNEKYGEQEASDIVEAILKVERYYMA
jgi:perosamine synthetase